MDQVRRLRAQIGGDLVDAQSVDNTILVLLDPKHTMQKPCSSSLECMSAHLSSIGCAHIASHTAHCTGHQHSGGW